MSYGAVSVPEICLYDINNQIIEFSDNDAPVMCEEHGEVDFVDAADAANAGSCHPVISGSQVSPLCRRMY